MKFRTETLPAPSTSDAPVTRKRVVSGTAEVWEQVEQLFQQMHEAKPGERDAKTRVEKLSWIVHTNSFMPEALRQKLHGLRGGGRDERKAERAIAEHFREIRTKLTTSENLHIPAIVRIARTALHATIGKSETTFTPFVSHANGTPRKPRGRKRQESDVVQDEEVIHAHDTYLKEINEVSLLTPQEEKELAVRIGQGDEAAREHLTRANLRLVVSIARKFTGKGLSIFDLIQEGNIGLLRAVEAFDEEMNTRFSTYASWWIKQGMQRAIVNQVKTVRVPAYLMELRTKYNRARNKLKSANGGRTPTDQEIAAEFKITERQFANLVKSLALQEVHENAEEGITLEDMAEDTSSNEMEDVNREQKSIDIARMLLALDAMDVREATVLRMRFGLNREEGMTLDEVGRKLGLTRERVRQIESEALPKLKERMERLENEYIPPQSSSAVVATEETVADDAALVKLCNDAVEMWSPTQAKHASEARNSMGAFLRIACEGQTGIPHIAPAGLQKWSRYLEGMGYSEREIDLRFRWLSQFLEFLAATEKESWIAPEFLRPKPVQKRKALLTKHMVPLLRFAHESGDPVMTNAVRSLAAAASARELPDEPMNLEFLSQWRTTVADDSVFFAAMKCVGRMNVEAFEEYFSRDVSCAYVDGKLTPPKTPTADPVESRSNQTEI